MVKTMSEEEVKGFIKKRDEFDDHACQTIKKYIQIQKGETPHIDPSTIAFFDKEVTVQEDGLYLVFDAILSMPIEFLWNTEEKLKKLQEKVEIKKAKLKEERLARELAYEKEMKQSRHKLYLKLKKEFEQESELS